MGEALGTRERRPVCRTTSLSRAALRRPRAPAIAAEQVLLLMMSTSGGAAGLTLTRATTAFLLEPPPNPGLEAQAAARIHRLGEPPSASASLPGSCGGRTARVRGSRSRHEESGGP